MIWVEAFLASRQGRLQHLWSDDAGRAVVAICRFGAQTWLVASVYGFMHDEGKTEELLDKTLQVLRGAGAYPIFLAGDFNMLIEDSNLWPELSRSGWGRAHDSSLATCFTPCGTETAIDHILLNRVGRAWVRGADVESENVHLRPHRPLWLGLGHADAPLPILEAPRKLKNGSGEWTAATHGPDSSIDDVWQEWCTRAVRCLGDHRQLWQGERSTHAVVEEKLLQPRQKFASTRSIANLDCLVHHVEQLLHWLRVCDRARWLRHLQACAANPWAVAWGWSAQLGGLLENVEGRVPWAELMLQEATNHLHHLRALDRQQRRGAFEEWKRRALNNRHKDLYRAVKEAVVPAPIAVRKDDGSWTASPQGLLAAFDDFWANLWKKTPEQDVDDHDHWVQCIPPGAPFRVGDMDPTALKQMVGKLSDKTPGLDGWRHSELARLPLEAWRELVDLYGRVQQEGRWPQGVAQTCVIFLAKPAGGPMAKDMRPICLLSCIYRIWARWIFMTHREHLSSWLPRELKAGRAGLRVEHHVWRLMEDIGFGDALGKYTSGIHTDLSKAYERIPLSKLRAVLARAGWPDGVLGPCLMPMRRLGA